MTGKILVTPAQLNNTAAEFSTAATEVRRLTGNMTSVVDNITRSIWTGDAANAYNRKFHSLDDDIARMIKMFLEHAEDLRTMANNYNAAEQNSEQLIKGLVENIIF